MNEWKDIFYLVAGALLAGGSVVLLGLLMRKLGWFNDK